MGKTLGYGEITVANVTEPFTVMLTNEAQQFATDSNRKVTSAQSYYTDIIVIRGSQERTDYTIGNITSGSGITVSKNSKRVTFSVNAGTTIGADTGVIEIPITLDGQTVKKQFSWSCGKQGPQGVKGNDGNSFAWNMLSETNCGKKHWGTESSGGKYSVEDFITEDNIDAVKLICTEAISTSNWSYVSFKDIKMLKQLKPSTKYTLSYDIKANRSGAISHSICKGDASNFCTNTVVVNNIIGNETWQHISVVLTTNDLKTTPTNEILYLGRNALSKVGYSIIKNLKLVEGDIDTPWSPSQSDIEGKGVVETVQYYLATSQASGVTFSTSGWSTDITTQKLTADKKYLWNCYQTKYSDGTSEPISTPKVIGVYGDKGTSTKIIRTGYKYTQNNIDTFSASGYSRTWGTADATTGLKVGDNVLLRVKNTTKGSDCLIFASITAIPSNYSLTCTSYGLIDNGADGQDGEDGAGFHWNLLKYSGDLSKQVLGGAGTYTATVESIEDKTTPSGQAEKITYTVQGTGGKFIQTGKYIKEGDIKQGKTYTVSVWCKCSSIKSTGVINAEFLDNKTYVNPTLSTEWQQYVVTGVANKDVTSTSSASAISFYYSDNMSVGDIFYISSPKVEEGDKASPWCTTYEETLAKNLSITPSSQYFKSTDGGKTFAPNAITIKPTIQGEISFGKWQYSIDGGVSFTDVVSGQKGLTISNNMLAVSKDSSLYSDAVTMITFRAVADDSSFYDTCSIAKIYDVSDIGDGRNLWITRDNITLQSCEKDKYIYITTGTSTVCIGADGSSVGTNTIALQTGTKYTISFVISSPSEVGNARWYFCTALNSTGVKNYGGYGVKLVTGENIVSQTITVDTSCDAAGLVLYHLPTGCVIKDIQVEKGSSPTGWTPAPEDLQTAILSTKSEISDVSLKVDKNKQAIEQRVEKTTYQQDLNLVKGDISKANEGLNKWRYEIYPKSLFASEYQGKSTMDVFAKNTNLTPSQSVLINDTDFGKSFAYGDNYIGYALTFVKFSAAKSVAITFKHDDGAHLYLNGKLIGGDDTCNTGSGESLTLSFIQGWNCLEVVLNEKSGGEYIGLGTTISALSECQLMNCYYGTPVARQSHITNQLVQNTTDIDGVSGSVQKVMSTVGGSGKIDEFVSNYATWKKKVDGIETRVGETYTTKDDFDDLQIGGRNLLKHSSMIGEKLICDNYVICNNCNIQEYTNDGFHIITPTEGNANNGIAFAFDNFTIMEINGGDTITFSCDIKGTSDSHAPFVSIRISDNNWYGSGVVQKNTDVSITKDWQRVSVTITTPTGLTKNHMWLAIHGNHQSDLYVRNFKLEKGNKPTDWTPAPEDVNGKIVNVETIANQTANKFQWIVKGGDSSSNFEITDRLMNLVSANINLDGIVSFMNTAKGDGRKNLYNLDYSSFENVASQEDAICYAKDNGVTSVGIDSSVSYDGDKSLKISYTTANLNSSTTPLYLGSSANNYGCVKIQAGKQYILSCYVKSDSTTGMFMIDIQGHDTPDTKTNGLYLSNIDPRKLPGSSTGVNLSTDWQRAVCAIKVADNATGLYWSVVPLIWGRPSSSSAPQTFNVWVDCIMLEEVDSISNEPGTYIFDKETIIDGGSIKTDTITGNQILAGSITADKIATDAIKSHNYISSGGTQGSFLNLGDGSFTSPNLSWDSNGNLIAKNANIIGNLTAGTVGEWKIDKYIYNRDKMFFDINKHNGQSIYNKNSTNNLFLGDGKVSSFYWFTTQNNTFIIENGNSPQYATGPAGISFGTNIAQGQIELYESVYPGNIIQDYEQTSHTSELSISGSKISFSYYDSNGSSFSDSPYTYIMADYARFYGDIFVQGSITTDEGVDVGGKLQASSIATKNGGLIETAGTVYGGGEIQCGGGQMRIIGGNYGILLRNDGYDFYILSTDSGSPWGSWNSKRPFRINLANGIPYFEYGIIIPNENYLLVNGYQLARGTSWGGVCIGDDSKRLRLYGTSIWASHSISTSDENLKENFTTLDQYEEFYMNLNPIGFNYIGDYDGKKTHFGFGAHKIEDILESEGYDADKFAVVTHRPLVQEDIEKRFGKDVTVDIETEYGVSYAEFIALNTHMIQKTRRELTKVKQEKADLEARLQIIEAKLGL